MAMWKDKQKQRFQRLRTCEQRQKLTDVERVELSRMAHYIEEEEASYLQPATRQLEKRNLLIAGQNTP